MATIGPSPRDPASNVGHYPAGVPRKLNYPDIPAWGLLERAALLMPGRLACHYHDVEWTWEELNIDAIRTAATLRRLGVKPGDRVGILLPNIPEYIIALNGIWRAQGIAVALSPMAVPEEVDRLLEATNCKVVICLDMLAGLISGKHRPDKTLFVSLRPRLPLFEQLGYLLMRKRRTGYWWMSATEHVGWFWDELKITDDESEDDVADESHWRGDWAATPAYILPTGGTTGEPKAVTLSHRNMVANAWQQYFWAGASVGKETLLAVLPFFHSYGLSTNVMCGTAMIGTLIMHHRFSTRKVIRLIEQHRPTVFHAVPAMLVAMNEHLRSHPADLSSLKWVISGGAPLPEDVGREFADHTGALIVEGYGLSEASPVTHVGPLNETARFGTIGLPLPDTDCRIVDPENSERDMPPGEVGELWVRGPQVMLGYWQDIKNQVAQPRTKVILEADMSGPPEDASAANDSSGSAASDQPQPEPVTDVSGVKHPAFGHILARRMAGNLGLDGGSELSSRLKGTADPASIGWGKSPENRLREHRPADAAWLPTGDLVRLTPEGLYQIVERIKDLIITSGFNVYPQEVEQVLKNHPSVKDAAVVGVPDEHKGEVVKAFVVLNGGANWDEKDLTEHCREHLSAHKRPRSIEKCADDLPRSFLGKVIRRKLRE